MKIPVTKELSKFLKYRRMTLRIKANELSEIISVVPAHISKFENGLIKTIDSELLRKWVCALYDDVSFEEALKNIYSYMEYFYPNDVTYSQQWLLYLDFCFREIELSPFVVSYLESLVKAHNISIGSSFGNFIPEEDSELNNKPYIFFEGDLHSVICRYPKIVKPSVLESEFVDKFFSNGIKSTTYVKVFTLAFSIFKRVEYPFKDSLTKSETRGILDSVETELAQRGFVTLGYKRRHIKKENTSLGTYDLDNFQTLNDIVNVFKSASEQDITLVNERLSKFLGNLRWDIGFMLKLCSFDFKTNLDSFSKKKELLDKLEQFVKEFQESNKDKPTLDLAAY